MRLATWTLLALVTALGAMGCRPETPRPGDVCLDFYTSSRSGNTSCQSKVCVAAKQEFKKASSQFGPSFVCERCTDIPANQLATDDYRLALAMRYESSELAIQFYFDNRVSLDFSLANLQKYALTADGLYKNSVGDSRFMYEPFEVLAYEGGKLHVRMNAKLIELVFHNLGEPMLIPIGGVPVINLNETCVYGHDISSWPPPADAQSYELAIDLDLPVTMTAY